MNLKRVLLLTILLLFLAACTLGGDGEEAEGTAPPAEDSPAPESTEEPAASNAVTFLTADGEEIEVIPPPSDGIALMLERVAAGDYTLPQAVIAGLRRYAGEEAGIDLFDDAEAAGLDGWRLSTLAVEAYALATPEEQAELERLYGKIVLSPEVLDAISAPADQAYSRPAGHASNAQQTECLRLWEEGFAPEAGTICLLYIEFTEGGHTYRVYYPEERRGDAAFLAYAEAAADALRQSVRVYGALTELRDINLIFTALTPPDEEGEDTAAFVPELFPGEITSVACPVLVLPEGASGGADDGFKQVIAHEVFHCVEYWRQGRSSDASADWYIEGMAEYFSGVVYPSADNEHQYLGGFNFFTATDSILDLQYSSWVFFQYLGDRFGKEFVIGMLDALPTSGGKSAQAAALAGIGDMATVFHEFGQAFLDGQLRDESGSGLPMSPYYLPRSRFALTPSPDRQLEAEPFQLSRYLLRYEEAKEYLIDLDVAGDAGMFTARSGDGGAWGELPLEIRIGCDPLVYVGLVTSAASSGDYTATAHTEWPSENMCDRCLIGTWLQDTPTIETNLRTIMGSGGMDIVSVTGQFILEIDESTMKFTPENYAVKFLLSDEITEMRIEGTSTGTYFIPAEGQIVGVQGEFAFTVTATNSAGTFTVPLGPEIIGMIPSPFDFEPIEPLDPADLPDPGELAGGEGSTATELGFTYECSDTTLTSYPPPGLGAPPSSTYVRISEPLPD